MGGKRGAWRGLVGRRQAVINSCSGGADCPRTEYHHPACLARYRTEREIAAGIRATDEQLRARRQLVQSDDVWAMVRQIREARQ